MSADRFRIVDVRAFVPVSTGTDYFSRPSGHWIRDSVIANPMSVYAAYKATRTSWGIDALGGLIVEIEGQDGTIGVGVSQGGSAGGTIVERHLARFLVGSDPRDVERLWDQMWRSTLPYGRKGLALHAISAIDLALWDLGGKLRDEPVYKLLGGATKESIPCYVTGIKPARYQALGYFGCKLPLPHGPADGYAGLQANVAMVERAREEVGPDFDLMLDCYMALDVPYTIDLANAVRPYRVRWIEEALPPDDYDGHARIKAACPWQRFTTGEHEYTRYGFRELIARAHVDILQPDLGWVGGITEARKIAAMAAAHDIPVVPHGSGVFSVHFQMATPNGPFQEILAMSPDGSDIVSIWDGLFTGDPLPEHGHVRPPDLPGWGIQLNPRAVARISAAP
ncbi:MAG: L-rhamnonate dehydratase [Chloroflexota bacterium]|nr:L-rhamnonate dehydratase [Chloroflexota bacterium]